MKNLSTFSLLAVLLISALAQAQDLTGEENLVKHPSILRPVLERYLDTIGMNAWAKDDLTISRQIFSGSVDTAWVRHYISRLIPSHEVAVDMAIDTAGYVFITGYSPNPYPPFDSDYLTIKYDAAGIEVWQVRYDGPGESSDFASAIAVDAFGNVYVTGSSRGKRPDDDYTTIKYNSVGVEQWAARYDGPSNRSDEATALAVDVAGNIYVTGKSAGANISDDYATIKYNSAGVEQWVARYNGPRNGSDQAAALTLDAAGNVYVTGKSTSSAGLWDYATLKYNSTGAEQWVAHYNGSGNYEDQAAALAVDADGNVYVTGTSFSFDGSFDYATVKYNSAGVEQWMARYNGPGNNTDAAADISVDAEGNVYVAGNSQGSGTDLDYATVQYDKNGVEQWVARYSGPGNTADMATALVVDASGNVYVTGNSGTIKYDKVGVQQWMVAYNGQANAILTDAAGNVYVTGRGQGTSDDYATVKYNSVGTQEWLARFDGAGYGLDQATALAINVDGNVYVTGWSRITNTKSDYATIKYNRFGDAQWIARHHGLGSGLDIPVAIEVDATGNVYVTGNSQGSNFDYTTIKYNSAGVEQWVASYNGPGNGEDLATALIIDAAGNVYVTGSSLGSGSDSDYATVKYNSAGVAQWVARYNGPGNLRDVAIALAVDAVGNVYVTGWSMGSGTNLDAALDYATIKYNAAGMEQWIARYNGPENSEDRATALALDAAGNVYVTGRSFGSGQYYDYATIKYNSAGAHQWTARYNGPGDFFDAPNALAVDADGNVYVTGTSQGSELDYATIKYSNAGAVQWVARYNPPGNDQDLPSALALDATGNVYVTGSSLGNYATVKYNNSGVEQWIALYHGPGTGQDVAVALAIDAVGNVYVTGSSLGFFWSSYTTIKYTQMTVAVDEKEIKTPSTHALAQNYPNPFNPETMIEYTIPAQANVALNIHNLQGQLVRVLVNGERTSGRYRVTWDGRDDHGLPLPSGVYLYHLQAGDFTATKKLAIIK